MKQSYQLPIRSESTNELAGDVARMLVASGHTYQDCLDALELVEALLLQGTKPTISDTLSRSDSERKL